MQSDPVADMLTRIRNGKEAKHRYVDVNFSKFNHSIAEVLKESGYVENILVNDKKHEMRIFLKYKRGSRESMIRGIKKVSKPGLRKYVNAKHIPQVFSGLGTAILSTPKGVVDGQRAKELKVGGEVLCFVW